MGKARIIDLESKEELERVFGDSIVRPYFLFKHSSVCGISSRVLKSVSEIESDVYLVTVQLSRDVSDAIAEMTGIRHESPQALIIKDGSCVFSASHFEIDPVILNEYLSNG